MTFFAEEEMEAYRMHNQRSFDPMAAFLGGGEEVSAAEHPRLSLTFVPQMIEKPKDKKDKGSSKHSRL
jgi:hypothetical protein